MTERTVLKIDYSKPPPGYDVDDHSDDEFHWSAPGEAFDLMSDGHCGAGTEAACLTSAWAHYKAHNDPPGLSVSEGIDLDDDWHGDDQPYLVSYDPRLSTDHDVQQALKELPLSNVCWVECSDELFATEELARAAAWAWYDRRLEAADRLGTSIAANVDRVRDHIRVVLAGIRELQPADATTARFAVEETTPGFVDAFNLWPRCLTWSDEQVAAVDRWLVGTIEMPGAPT